jgi:MFS family permease
VLFIPCAIWMALSQTYVAFSVARVFAGMTASFSQTVPPSTVSDIFVPAVMGSKMAMYVVAIVTAPAAAPFFCGLIVHAGSWRNLFWFILGLAGLQLVLFFFLVPETQWVEDAAPGAAPANLASLPGLSTGDKASGPPEDPGKRDQPMHIDAHGEHLGAGHVGVAWYPWQRPGEYLKMFFGPILMLKYFTILVPSFYYGMSFGWLVGITVVTPQTLGPPPYSFAVIPLGCAFLAFGIGAVAGFWCGGIVGDKTVAYFERKKGTRQPEDRLWAVFPMMPLMFAAMLVIGFALSRQLHWIALLVGGGLWFFAISVITGLLQTYVLECFLPAGMDSMAVFNAGRMLWGFAVPFFVWSWGSTKGWLGCYVTQGALSAGLGTILCAFLLWKGRSIRAKQNMPIWE